MPTLLTPLFPSSRRTGGAQHVEDPAKGGAAPPPHVEDLEDGAQGDTAKGGAVPGEAISLGERSRQWASSPLRAHRAHERPMPPASIAHPDPVGERDGAHFWAISWHIYTPAFAYSGKCAGEFTRKYSMWSRFVQLHRITACSPLPRAPFARPGASGHGNHAVNNWGVSGRTGAPSFTWTGKCAEDFHRK